MNNKTCWPECGCDYDAMCNRGMNVRWPLTRTPWWLFWRPAWRRKVERVTGGWAWRYFDKPGVRSNG